MANYKTSLAKVSLPNGTVPKRTARLRLRSGTPTILQAILPVLMAKYPWMKPTTMMKGTHPGLIACLQGFCNKPYMKVSGVRPDLHYVLVELYRIPEESAQIRYRANHRESRKAKAQPAEPSLYLYRLQNWIHSPDNRKKENYTDRSETLQKARKAFEECKRKNPIYFLPRERSFYFMKRVQEKPDFRFHPKMGLFHAQTQEVITFLETHKILHRLQIRMYIQGTDRNEGE